ncbi:MAG: hypothetical protein ACXVR1_02705 [Solirubrobacteraceae bacterium]
MDEHDFRVRVRAEQVDEELAIRKAQRRMASEERTLELELEAFEASEERVERQIEGEWRREHHGHEPERPPEWRTHEG